MSSVKARSYLIGRTRVLAANYTHIIMSITQLHPEGRNTKMPESEEDLALIIGLYLISKQKRMKKSMDTRRDDRTTFRPTILGYTTD